jgi:hypothetical protein
VGRKDLACPFDGLGSQEEIDMGEPVPKVFPISLDQTTGHQQAAAPSSAPVFDKLFNDFKAFLNCLLDETAGIQDDYVGLGRVRYEREALPEKPGGQDLRIHLAFRAAQRDEADRCTVSGRLICHGLHWHLAISFQLLAPIRPP